MARLYRIWVTTLNVSLVVAGAAAAQGVRPSATSPESTPLHGHEAAITHLQEARSTLARITEHSTSQDARARIAPVTAAFAEVYKAYTGRAPEDRSTATHSAAAASRAAAAGRPPARQWDAAYRSLDAAIARLVTRDSHDPAVDGLPKPALDDVLTFRSEIDEFHKAASTSTKAGRR